MRPLLIKAAFTFTAGKGLKHVNKSEVLPLAEPRNLPVVPFRYLILQKSVYVIKPIFSTTKAATKIDHCPLCGSLDFDIILLWSIQVVLLHKLGSLICWR
jgi:hypothetical protein